MVNRLRASNNTTQNQPKNSCKPSDFGQIFQFTCDHYKIQTFSIFQFFKLEERVRLNQGVIVYQATPRLNKVQAVRLIVLITEFNYNSLYMVEFSSFNRSPPDLLDKTHRLFLMLEAILYKKSVYTLGLCPLVVTSLNYFGSTVLILHPTMSCWGQLVRKEAHQI